LLAVGGFEFIARPFVELSGKFDRAVGDHILIAMLVEDNLEFDERLVLMAIEAMVSS
jgi:hypothetical protein